MSEAFAEVYHIIHTSSGTTYRLRPNPDGEGYESGAALDWSDDCKEWHGYIFIAPEAMRLLGEALRGESGDE